MITPSTSNPAQKTTSWKSVAPFYGYAALSFLFLTIFLLFSTDALMGHFFQPRVLALTHLATLGWGTMIILGASHQLIPVMVDGAVYSEGLARASFWITGIGIPVLVCSFWHFTTNWPMQLGAILVLTGISIFLINVLMSILAKKRPSIQVYFLATAACWLFLTALAGSLLAFNFTYPIFSRPHLHYLRLHAHMGLAGWFLLLVIGVGSRLIPMFMISKYTNDRLLWWVYVLINLSLILFITDSFYTGISIRSFVYLLLGLSGVLLFASYCYKAWRKRIRKKLEIPMQFAMGAVGLLILPLIAAAMLIIQILTDNKFAIRLTIVYGSLFLLGWMTALILGMTFKTLPFIIWNKVYFGLTGKKATPSPKDLVNARLLRWQMGFYFPALILFEWGILLSNEYFIKSGAILFLLTAIVYNVNVGALLMHKVKPGSNS